LSSVQPRLEANDARERRHDTAIGVLKNEEGVEILPATIAWKIDDKQMKFVTLPTE
jgi:hypothetical protein